ncbi:MAG TPA: LuxR C-terminal-related transcriptional regulator [Fulvivirga sp.]|nr:LuxR C-terminal-related transcriptional regulator [Fulvivirga sp.]
MMDKSRILLNIYDSHKNYLAKNSIPPQKLNFEEIVGSFFCPGPFYYYIIDSPTLTFENVSSQVFNITGLDLEGKPVEEVVKIIHPDDMDFFLKCEDFVASFLKNKVTPDKMMKYKITYSLRERTKDGSYKLFLLQTITLANTDDGGLLKVLGVHTDISHITNTNNYKLSLIGLDGEPSYYGIDVFESESYALKDNLFSPRELEVIILLGEGLTAKEIASQLFVSTETIISHKKNALAKSDCKNSTQLVSFCIRHGLI